MYPLNTGLTKAKLSIPEDHAPGIIVNGGLKVLSTNELENLQKIAKEIEPTQTDENHPPVEDVISGKVPVYHGTFGGDFDQFDPTKLGTNTGAASAKEGFFFSTNKKVAESYGSKTNKRIKEIQPQINAIDDEIEKLTGDSPIQVGFKLIQLEVNKTPAYSEELNQKVRDLLDKKSDLEDELQGFEETWMNDQIELADEGKLKEVRLNVNNIFIKDYKGANTRDESFHNVIKRAKEAGHDGVVFKNVFDGGDPAGNDHMTDIYVVFDQNQIINKPISDEQGSIKEQVSADSPEKGAGAEDTLPTGIQAGTTGTKEQGTGELAAGGEEKIVNPIDSSLPYNEQIDELNALSYANKPLIDDFLATVDKTMKTTVSKSSFKDKTQILLKSNRPSIIKEKPWFTIAHVRDSFRFKTAVENLDQVEDVLKMLAKTDWQVIKFDWTKMFDPNDWGWRIISIDLRMPNGQLVEYYMPIKGIAEGSKEANHLLFEKWRNKDVSKLSHQEWKERDADIATSVEIYTKAWEDYLATRNSGAGTSASAERASFINILNRLSEGEIGLKLSLRSSEEAYPQDHLPAGDLTAAKSGSITDTATLPEDVIETDSERAMSNVVSQGKDTKPEGQKQEFAGESIKYEPFENWESNLAAAREYARKLFSKEELDAFTASGQLKWNDTPSIVKIIKDKLSQAEPKAETKPAEPEKEPTVSTEGITSPGIDITKNEFLVLDVTKGLKSAYRRGYLDKLGIDETQYTAIKESLYKKRLLLAGGGIEGIGRAVVAGLYKRAGINAIQGDAYRNADSAVLKLWDVKPKSDFAGDHILVVKPTPDHPEAVPSFDEWFAKIRFYKSGGTDNYELPDGTKGIGKKDNIEWFKGRYEKYVTKTGPYNPIHQPKPEFAGETVGTTGPVTTMWKYINKLSDQNVKDEIAHQAERGVTLTPERIEEMRQSAINLHSGTFAKLKEEIDARDFEALKKRWFYNNKTWKAFFEEYTGVKLGKLQRDIEKNLGIFTAKGAFGSENKPNFVSNERDSGISDTPGLSTSEVDGGLPDNETITTLPGAEDTGLPGQTGGVSGGSDQSIIESRQDEALSGGGSDRESISTGGGEGPAGTIEGAGEDIPGDRAEPKNVADQNHIIEPDDVIIPKGEITKARANIAAIELLVKLEKLGRNATPAEKQTLAKYTGWGGLASVLDQYNYRNRDWNHEWNKKYGSLHEKLLTLLTPEEFRSAINSTINAHFTSITIIRGMWQLAERLGFKGGNALEPAGGIGHFIGAMPKYLSGRTAWTSYELDSVTGRILAKLYPQANVQIKGYQDSTIPLLSQDLIITNVPFARDAPYDAKNKDLSKFSLHNYFIAKGIKQLKPGGVGIFITSASTMDNPASSKFRQWVVTEGNADFIGAIRLPNDAFKENAGTEVTTDILVFRKRTSEVPSENAKDFRITDTIGTGKGDYNIDINIDVNQYFVDNPDNILGKMMIAAEAGSGGLYSGNSQTASPIKGMNLIKAIEERIATFPEGIMDTSVSKKLIRREQAQKEEKDGTIVVKNGNAYEVSGGELVPTSWTDEKVKIQGKQYQARKVAEDYINLKETTNKLLDIERDPKSTDADIDVAKKELNKVYDNFVKNYGEVNKNKSLLFLEDDSEFNMVAGLEDINVDVTLNKAGRTMRKYTVSKSQIFTKRVNFPVVEPTEADNIEDAFNISLSYRNNVDPEFIASLVGSSTDQISHELIQEGYAFRNPKTGLLEEKDEYLSGYVKTKYKEAIESAKDNPDYELNVKALEVVLPKTIPGQLVKFRLGTPWMPADIVKDFIKEVTDLDVKVSWIPGIDKWALDTKTRYYSAKNNTSGAGGMTGIKLIEHAMHLSRPKVMIKEPGEDKPRVDHEATAAAIGKMEEILDNFVNFVYDKPEYVTQIEKVYNDEYNNFIEKKQSLPTFKHYPGANENINLYIHQRKGVERGKKSSLLLAHQVGTGKTFTMVTTAMELRRLNLAKKPMIIVQNSTIEQFSKSFRLLYPGAKLLVAQKNDSKPDKRQRIFNKIAYGDWDAIILPQSFLNFIPDDPAREQAYIDEKIEELKVIRDDAKTTGGSYNNPVYSEAQNAIKAIEKKLVKVQEKKQKVKDIAKANLSAEKKVRTQLSRRKDDVRTFEKMGVDALFVDEAHAYKKLGFATSMSSVRGIDTTGSQRALSLMLKIKYVQEKMNGRNVILATGTPISNTMAEVWTMMKYIAPEVLKAYHIESFDAFASTYGKVEPSLEFTASGKFKTVDRFKSYQNAPELMLAFRANTDVVLTEDIPEFKQSKTIPKLKDGKITQVIIPQTKGLTDMMAMFKDVMEKWEAMTGAEKKENRHISLVVFTRAKQAAIDLRLLSPSFEDDPGSKTNSAIKEVLRIYKSTQSYKGTQVIFSDMYQSPDKKGEVRFNLYKDIKQKLINEGVPADEIEIIADQADTIRENIFDKFNDGEIRILLGSTDKLGTGVNIQTLLAAAHFLDIPNRPMDFEQRLGRVIRQGNMHAEWDIPVEVLIYGVEKTLDATGYQRNAIKMKFINQMMKGEGLDRDVADAAEEEMATDMTFDQMMATLTGSQYAILLYQKEYNLRKLQTAYRSYQRNIIESNQRLKYEIEYAQKAKERLIIAQKAEKLLHERFKDGKITSLTVSWKDGKPVELFKGGERKDVAEKLLPYLQKLADKTLNIKKEEDTKLSLMTKDQRWNSRGDFGKNEIRLYISVNGFNGTVIFETSSLIDTWRSAFSYRIPIIPEMYKDISSGFTNASGLVVSVEAQAAKMIETLVPDEEKNLKEHNENIPVYQEALRKTFDKTDQLEKLTAEVTDLKLKIIEEAEANKGKGNKNSDDLDLNIEIDDGPAEPDPQYMRRPKEPDMTENLPSIWDNPEYPKYQASPGAFAGEEIGVMKEHEFLRRAKIMADYTGVPIDVLKTKNELPDRIKKDILKRFGPVEDQTIPAVYDKGHVWVVMEDTKSVSEMVVNMSHEIFAHHGLPALLGQEQYEKVLKLVYRGMSPVDVVNVADNYDTPESDWKTVAEEYLGDMSGNNQTDPTLWQRIVAAIKAFIRKIFNISMSKSEIVVLLKKSKDNLVRNKPKPTDYDNIGNFLDAMTAFTSGGKTEGNFGYGVHLTESKLIDESVSKGNMDYQTYFGVAKSVIGERAAVWIEKALTRNDFDSEKALDYLEEKMDQYSRFERHFNLVKDARNYLSDNEPKHPETLYKVLVGKGKTPQELDFLTWDKPANFDQQERIMNQLDVEGKYDITLSGAFNSGESLYNKIVSIYGSEREASLLLSRAGIDGMRHKNEIPTTLGTAISDGYVVYDNTPVDRINDIQYKRTKKPTFVGDHLARAGEVYTDKAITKRNWNETVAGMREYLQDMNMPVRKFEEEIIKRGGLQPNDAKPYRDISLSFGRQETLYKDFTNTKMKPINETVAKIIRSGMPGENVLPYIISKHAIERNMVFRARELDEFINKPALNDPTQAEIDEFRDSIADKDYSGVMAFDVNNEFVNPDELAQTIVDEFEQIAPKSLVTELWDNIRRGSSTILDTWEKGQQLSPDQKQGYLDQFQYFVPLRGWREGAAKDLVYVKGEGFKKSLIHAEGRKSLADNPLAYMQSVAFSAIGEQVDNEVKTSMLRLVMRNLSGASLYDLVTVKKLYYVRIELPDGTHEWEPTIDRPDQSVFDKGDAVLKIYNEYQKLRIPKQAREHEVMVKRQSGDVVMVFKGNMLNVAQSMNKRNFMYHNIFGHIKDARTMNQAVTGLAYMNNFLKAAYTSWNIVFPFTNFMRDVQEASITQLIKGDAGHKVIANYHRAFPSIIRFLGEKLDMNNPDDVKLRDFYLVGGATGFTHLLSANDLEKSLMSEINRMVGRGTVRGEIKHYAHETVQVVSMWNQVFEDATRFSVYLTSIDLGKSKEEAASDAKEASVNFNRKGKSSKLWDSIYAFWNVAWQSLQKNFKLAKDYPKAFVSVASAFMALGFLEALLNKATDDEDPENDYYNMNSYMRENYLVLPNLPRIISGESKGNKYLSIPLPQFWRGFKSIGSLAFDLTQGQVTVKEAISKAMINFGTALTPVDIGGFFKSGEFSLAPLVPTVAKPFYDIATNRNYMGYTIAREPFDKAQEKLLANSGLGKANVNPTAKFLTDMLFRWGGGDNATKYYISKSGEEKKVPGFLDVNPSFVEHLFKGYTGGTGAVFSDLITTISQVLKPDEEVSFKNIPFVNRFIRETPEAKWNIIAEYYNLKDVVSVHKGLKRDYQKQAETGGSTEGIEATEGSSYYQQYQDVLDSYDKDIKDISDQVDFNDVEGTKPVYDLMQKCINDIKALKEQYKMK